MRRLSCAIAIVAAVGLAAAPGASAGGGGGPVTVPVPDFHGTLVGFCAFPVHFRSVINHETTTFYPDGRSVTRGKLTVAIRNTKTGKHTVIDVSGPTFTYPRPGGHTLTVLKARAAVFYLADESGLGHPIFWMITHGEFRVITDADGTNHLMSYPAHHINLCQRLA
jgi:hypothetical protein